MPDLDRDISLRSSISRPAKTPKNQHARNQRGMFEVDEEFQRYTQTSSFKLPPSSSNAKASSANSAQAKRSFLTTNTASSFVFPSTATPSARPSSNLSAKLFQATPDAEQEEADIKLVSDFSSPLHQRTKSIHNSRNDGNKKRKLNSLVLRNDDIEIMSSPALTENDDDELDNVVDQQTSIKKSRNTVIVIEDDVEHEDIMPANLFDGENISKLPTSSPLEREEKIRQSMHQAHVIEENDAQNGDHAERIPENISKSNYSPATPPRNVMSTNHMREANTKASSFRSFSNPSPQIPSLFSANRVTQLVGNKRTVPLPTKPTYVLPPPRSPSSGRSVDTLSRPPLPTMDWSPSHRRRRSTNAKYKPGGLAATTLGWVFDAQDAMLRSSIITSGIGIQGTQSRQTNSTSTLLVIVREARKEEAYVAIEGVVKKPETGKMATVGSLLKVLLISDGKNAWAGKVRSGVEVVLGEPLSEVELGGEVWKTAINWKLLELS